jgi:hypothetical protein
MTRRAAITLTIIAMIVLIMAMLPTNVIANDVPSTEDANTASGGEDGSANIRLEDMSIDMLRQMLAALHGILKYVVRD